MVHGPNEAGKSTLHAALSAALFGLVGSGRRRRDDTARIERFRPWDGARYAATAEVVAAGGRRLRLEWDFDRARVAVVDAAAGSDVTRDYGGGDSDELVRALWGVERGVYLHLGHVAQAELARISDPAGVRHAIEAVVGQGAADSPAQAAVAALKEQRARLVGLNSAATKPLARARAERDRLADAVAVAAAERGAVDELASERDSARAAVEAADRRVHALDHAAAHVRARELRRRIEWADEAERAAVAAAAVVEREAAHAEFVPSTEVGTLRHRLRDLEAERDRRSGERVLDTQRLTEVERERAALAARVGGARTPPRGIRARRRDRGARTGGGTWRRRPPSSPRAGCPRRHPRRGRGRGRTAGARGTCRHRRRRLRRARRPRPAAGRLRARPRAARQRAGPGAACRPPRGMRGRPRARPCRARARAASR